MVIKLSFMNHDYESMTNCDLDCDKLEVFQQVVRGNIAIV